MNKENKIKIHRVKYMIVCYVMFALIVARNNMRAYHWLIDDQQSTGARLQHDNLGDFCENLVEKVNNTSGGSTPTLNPEITDWESYVKNLRLRSANMTKLQRGELCKSEIGRVAEVEIRVRDVGKRNWQGWDYDEEIVIDAEYLAGGDCHRIPIRVLVQNVKGSRQAYKQALLLKKGMSVRVLGRIYYNPLTLNVLEFSPELEEPEILAIKLKVVDDEG